MIASWVYGPSLPLMPLINDRISRLEDLGFSVFSNLEMGIKALGISSQYTIRNKVEE
jgi:hypothetical protein